MDDNEDNDNNHISTPPDESDVNVSRSEMLSGIVSVNSAPSLGIQTQAPQHVIHVTTIDVNAINIGSSQHSVQGCSSPISNQLQSFSGNASKKALRMMILLKRQQLMLINLMPVKILETILLVQHLVNKLNHTLKILYNQCQMVLSSIQLRSRSCHHTRPLCCLCIQCLQLNIPVCPHCCLRIQCLWLNIPMTCPLTVMYHMKSSLFGEKNYSESFATSPSIMMRVSS